MSTPTYLYKILEVAPPSPLPETLPATDLDSKDRFIHLSKSSQVPITADLFFAKCDKLWILKLRTSALDGAVKYSTDPAARVPQGCAHLHGSRTGLGKGNIEEVFEVAKAEKGSWKEVTEMQRLSDG